MQKKKKKKNNKRKKAYPTASKSSSFCFFSSLHSRQSGSVAINAGLGHEGKLLFPEEKEEENDKKEEKEGNKMTEMMVIIGREAEFEQTSFLSGEKAQTGNGRSHPAPRSIFFGPIGVGLGSPFETEAYVWLGETYYFYKFAL